MKPTGSVNMAHGATPAGGEAGRCSHPKLKNCNIKNTQQKRGDPVEDERAAGRGVVKDAVAP